MVAVARSAHNRARNRIGWFAVTLCLVVGPLEGARADDSTAQSTVSVGTAFAWINEAYPAGVPQALEITINIQYSGSCTGEDTCHPPPNAAWKLTIYDCHKDKIMSFENTYIVYCGPGGGGTEDIVRKISICGRIPRYYKTELFQGMRQNNNHGPCTGGGVWTDPGDVPIALPTIGCASREAYGGDFDAFKQDLDCLACVGQSEIPDRGAVAPHDGFVFYKTRRNGRYTLYTQPVAADNPLALDSPYGEMVRGLFQPSEDGFLLVEVKDSTVGLVEVVGVDSPNDCLPLSENESFTFDVRTGRGDPKGGLDVLLDWFWWERDPVTTSECCLRHEYRRLELEVRSMCPDSVDPVIPQRARVTRGSSQAAGESDVVASEVRIPTCGTKACPDGNLTRWFVLWPGLEAEGTASEGFAKGWKIIGDLLIPPGGGEEEAYEFED